MGESKQHEREGDEEERGETSISYLSGKSSGAERGSGESRRTTASCRGEAAALLAARESLLVAGKGETRRAVRVDVHSAALGHAPPPSSGPGQDNRV